MHRVAPLPSHQPPMTTTKEKIEKSHKKSLLSSWTSISILEKKETKEKEEDYKGKDLNRETKEKEDNPKRKRNSRSLFFKLKEEKENSDQAAPENHRKQSIPPLPPPPPPPPNKRAISVLTGSNKSSTKKKKKNVISHLQLQEERIKTPKSETEKRIEKKKFVKIYMTITNYQIFSFVSFKPDRLARHLLKNTSSHLNSNVQKLR